MISGLGENALLNKHLRLIHEIIVGEQRNKKREKSLPAVVTADPDFR